MNVLEHPQGSYRRDMEELADALVKSIVAGKVRSLVVAYETDEGKVMVGSFCADQLKHIALCEVAKQSELKKY